MWNLVREISKRVSLPSHRPMLRAARGFTLIETILSMVVISIAVVGITSALSNGFRHQSDGIWQAKASALGQAYVEEILSRRFDEQSPLGGVPACSAATVPCSGAASFNDGESRAQFDDVDDYDGVSDLPPVDADGIARTGYDGYRVQVSVSYPTAAQVAALSLTSAQDAKVIEVTVTPPGQSAMRFTALKANF